MLLQKQYYSISRSIFVSLNMNQEVSTISLLGILPSVNIIYTENKWKKYFFKKN